MWGSDVTFHSVTKYINGKMYFCFLCYSNGLIPTCSQAWYLSFQVDSVCFSIANRVKTFVENC